MSSLHYINAVLISYIEIILNIYLPRATDSNLSNLRKLNSTNRKKDIKKVYKKILPTFL